MPRKKDRGLSLVRTSGGLEIGERFGLCICAQTRVYAREEGGGGVAGPGMHVLRND